MYTWVNIMSKRERNYENIVTTRLADTYYENLIKVALAKKKTISEMIRTILEDYLK